MSVSWGPFITKCGQIVIMQAYSGRIQVEYLLCLLLAPSKLHSSPLVYCGETVGWIRMPLCVQVGPVLSYIVLDGDLPQKGHMPPVFHPMSVVAKPLDGSRCHLVQRQPSAQVTLCQGPRRRGTAAPPTFCPVFIVAKRLDGSICRLVWMQASVQLCYMGTQLRPHKGHSSPQFSARVYCGQLAGWIKMPPGTAVGLYALDTVLDDTCRQPGASSRVLNCGHSTQYSHLVMVALCNRADHYIFMLRFVVLLLSFFSSPNLSGRRLDVYHTLAHGVALVRIQNAGLKRAARRSLKVQDAKKSPKIANWAPLHNFVWLYLRN